MPTVGGRHFPYTPKGEEAAKKYAKKTGAPLKTQAERDLELKRGHGPKTKKEIAMEKKRGIDPRLAD